MVDLKLKRVTIRNWMKFRNVVLDMPEKGMVLVQGVNTASGGALQSVGSGKTGIGEAISRTLLGVSGRFTTLKQFSTDKSGDTYVKVEAELHGKPLIVESGYKCSELSASGDALRYRYDGKTIERGKIDQTRGELSKLLGVTPLLASWTVFIDGDHIKFNKLGQADSVELVMASLRQPPWNDHHETSKKTVGAFRRSMASVEGKHEAAAETARRAQEALDEAEEQVKTEIARYESAVASNNIQISKYQKAIERNRQAIVNAQTEAKGIAKKLKLMESERAAKNHQLEIKLHDIEDEIAAAEEARKPLSKARETAQQALTEARVAVSNYKEAGKNCPTCQRPLGKIDQKRLQSLETNQFDADAAYTKAREAWAVADKKVADLNAQYRQVSKEQKEVSSQQEAESLAERNEEIEISITSATNQIHDWELEVERFKRGPSDSAVKTAEGRVADRKDALVKATNALREAANEVAADMATVRVLDYWVKAFSPYGIPNMILRDAIAPLNKEARRVSAEMTGGTIEVRYNTIRDLAGGGEKAQLNIEVDNKLGDKDLAGSSKGEAGLTNFIIAETLSEVGQVSRRIGYMWLDEILPNQDPKVCHSIYRYLREKAERLGIVIFLVDHNPVAANYADRFMLVEKSGGFDNCTSTVSWR